MMKYIIAGLFNSFLVQYSHLNIDIHSIFKNHGGDSNILNNPISKVHAAIFMEYLERLVNLSGNRRIGLESGFLIPFMLTGTFYNLYQDCKTVQELFENLQTFDSTANNFTETKIKTKGDFLYYELTLDTDLAKKYPVAMKQWNDMQYGIGLQYAYSFTGRFLHPISAYSIYAKDGDSELLEDYLGCPVEFEQKYSGMAFKKNVLNLPIITSKKELLPIFEHIMGEIEYQHNSNTFSKAVRRYITYHLSLTNLNLTSVSQKFYMSERTVQRKLKAEGTSYQELLDDVRIELAEKYLKKQISMSELAFLLGFESQSAFNSFFRKHFQTAPSDLQKKQIDQ